MKKRILAIVLICFFMLKTFGQAIHYTNNKLYTSDYSYKIVGEVKNNLIVWATGLDKHYASKIFVYDNSMNLINTINTNILQSDPEENARFFITGNTFQVLYPYQTKKDFQFKLAAFSENGEMLFNRVLDSISISGVVNNENTSYQILRSQYNKVTCFAKTLSDVQHHMVQFSFSFIDGNTVIQRTFNIPFHEDHEDITDMLVDDDKNILLLKQQKLDTAVNIMLVKLNFKDNFILGSTKSVSNHFFTANSMHIAQKAGGYTVSGLLREENKNFHDENKDESLYVWQLDNDLDDAPGDVILEKQFTNNNTLRLIPSTKTNTNTFAVCNLNEADANEYMQPADNYKIRIPNYSADPTYLVKFNDLNPDAIATSRNRTTQLNTQTILKDKDSYAKTLSANTDNSFDELPVNTIAVLKVDSSNNILWTNIFATKLDDVTKANLNNSKIIYGDKNLHLIYEAQIKNKPRLLNHTIIQKDGTISETHFTNWNKKCKYDLNEGVITGKNELIVPVYKDNKISFASLRLE